MTGPSALSIIYTVNLVCKLASLLLENIQKRRLLLDPLRYSPEELAGPLSRVFFAWLTALLRLGYGTILSLGSLTPLSQDLKSVQLAPKLGMID